MGRADTFRLRISRFRPVVPPLVWNRPTQLGVVDYVIHGGPIKLEELHTSFDSEELGIRKI